MLKKYHVVYFNGVEELVFKVLAISKQDACNKFRKVISKTYKIIEIINYDTVVAQKKLIKIIGIIALVVTLISCIFVANKTWNKPEATSYNKYIVEQGDTLWDIAKHSNGWNKIDNSYIVEDIKLYSDCDSIIHSGQVVYIPVYELD